MSDEQQIEQQPAESPAEDQVPVAAPAPKKNGKPTGQGGDSKAADAALATVGKRMDRLDSLVTAIDKAAKAHGLALVRLEQGAEAAEAADKTARKSLGAMAEDVNAMRTLVLKTSEDVQALAKSVSTMRSQFLSALDQYAKGGRVDRLAIIATCEALTGITPKHAGLVRDMVAKLKANDAGKPDAQRAEPVPDTPWWRRGWVVLAAAGVTVVGFAALLL